MGRAMHVYTRLDGGGWGVLSQVEVRVGDSVNVERRDGSIHPHRIQRVVGYTPRGWVSEIRCRRGSRYQDGTSGEGLRRYMRARREEREARDEAVG